MNRTGGDVVGLIVSPFIGRRSSGEVKIASLEATVNSKAGYVAFDVDLYNPRAGLRNFFRHLGEVGYNKEGRTTHPADVARALVARRAKTLVKTK